MHTEAIPHRGLRWNGHSAAVRPHPAAPLEVAVVSSSPIVARALRQLLASRGEFRATQRLLLSDNAGPTSSPDPDLVLLMPQGWRELAAWVPDLIDQISAPWLLIAEPRLAGMFLSRLELRPGMYLPSDASVAMLWRALQALADGYGSSLRHDLLGRFSQGMAFQTTQWPRRLPTVAELQCGCAASLGLSNREIAGALLLAEATVKTHLHHLLAKFKLSNRQELAAAVRQAFAPASQGRRRPYFFPREWHPAEIPQEEGEESFRMSSLGVPAAGE